MTRVLYQNINILMVAHMYDDYVMYVIIDYDVCNNIS